MQIVRSVVDQRGNDVLARRRKVWVQDRRDEDIEERRDRYAPIFRVVVRPLQILEGRTDPKVRGDRFGSTGKSRRPIEGEVHLRDDTVHFKVPTSASTANEAFSSSVSNHSFRKSRTDIGGMRSICCIVSLPRRRTASARRKRPICSLRVGAATFGGVIVKRGSKAVAKSRRNAVNRG